MKFKKIVISFSALFLIGALSACHTVHGAGQDLVAGGQALSKSAARHGGDGKATVQEQRSTD